MIDIKRSELQRFITEQTLGPGASGYRFVRLNDENVLQSDLTKAKGLSYHNELINIVPAGVYSTGILFPVDKSRNENALANLFEKESVTDGEANLKESEETSIEEDSIPIDQMYPNTMGLSCCMRESVTTSELIVRVNARYYTRCTDISEQETQFGVLCECDPVKLIEFINNIGLANTITVVNKGLNTILSTPKLKSDQIKNIQELLRTSLQERADKIKNDLSEFDFARKSAFASSLKQACYYELRNKCAEPAKQNILYRAIEELEETESFISHVDDLLSVNGEGYGLWQSNIVDKYVSLGALDFSDFALRKTFTFREHDFLRNVFEYRLEKSVASLSLNIQVSRNSRKKDNKIYLKVQLVNNSTPFVKDPEDSRYYSTFNELVNQRCFFGAKISVVSKDILSYNEIDVSQIKHKYDEDDVTKFIYRRFKDYAIGHGCSVKWQRNGDIITVETEYLPVCDTPDVESIPRNKGSIVEVNKHFEPEPYFSSSNALEFKWLSTFSSTTDVQVINSLNDFVRAYQSWIDRKRSLYSELSELERSIANQELNKCQADKDRMAHNIDDFLVGEKNKENIRSFRLMNSAMFMQIWHSVRVKGDSVKNEIEKSSFRAFDQEFYQFADDRLFSKDSGAAWRPFQLAFILLNLDGIFRISEDLPWDKRNELVDLVWFPTGGGKTEAYLGIIALAIINRRLSLKQKGGGTAVLMRYTLRLLTLQQFQRATLVIMALELIRRWNPTLLGEEPIFIGLWVGDNSLPNKLTSTDPDDRNTLLYEFKKLDEGQRSRVPYEYCPWCRSKLHPATKVESDEKNVFHFNRLHLRCSNSKCSFHYRPARARDDQGPIPVSLCDDEIYQHPPALLFGTVDKFAQLAHKVSNDASQRNKDSRRIFGKGNWEDGKPKEGYIPPDLIIQDELHLLLGPLGSSVALFESAIIQLCTRSDGTQPKIISSTATTRNTELQILALFDRKVNLFPKPGVECDDSFFSFYKRVYKDKEGTEEEFQSKRRYIGVLPTGRTQIWMQMRVAAILLTHRALFEINQLKQNTPLDFESYTAFEKAMDYYHTVVSYFNSLKEVGKTESQIHTYLVKEIRRVFNRVIRPSKLSHGLYTYSVRPGELTGRLSGEDVKTELDKVQKKWNAQDRFAHWEDNEVKHGSTPPDFVVATNMISVGIDVSRFNTILINSMPRNIAEYIQASSRVAREVTGLVLTIHHPFRARDVSHYEKFIEFHEKMYSYVEPISITPFTEQAIERYLGLYLATMIRHTTKKFNNRESAGLIREFTENEIAQLSEHLVSYFEKRSAHLQSIQIDRSLKNILRESNLITIRKWIDEALHEWSDIAKETFEDHKTLVFKNKRKANPPQEQLYVDIEEYQENIHSEKWQIPMSLRVIEPEAILKIKLK